MVFYKTHHLFIFEFRFNDKRVFNYPYENIKLKIMEEYFYKAKRLFTSKGFKKIFKIIDFFFLLFS
jgi:hypothetical protein